MNSIADPVPNLPLLRKVLDHIDAHPEEWDQSNYVLTEAEQIKQQTGQPGCGTAYCIAGHAVAMTIGSVPSVGLWARQPSNGQSWFEAGQDALNISYYEAVDLFAGHNTRAGVQAAAERIAARAGERL